jgi:hypothetical protein
MDMLSTVQFRVFRPTKKSFLLTILKSEYVIENFRLSNRPTLVTRDFHNWLLAISCESDHYFKYILDLFKVD